jgi:tetratricopeptide (TPR) repeat protein
MNKQEFETIFENLAFKRKEVLHKVLAGETDAAIARTMGIAEATVRKHIERICLEFGLENKHSDERRYKRTELVALFAKYKPELLIERTFTTTKKVVPAEIPETKNRNEFINQIEKNSSDEPENAFRLDLISMSSAINEHLEKQFQESNDKEQKIQIAKSLNQMGYKYYLEGNFQSAVFYLEWAVKFDHNFGSAYYNLGSAYEKLSNILKSRHHYKNAIKYGDRAASAAINNLARLEIIDGKSTLAVSMIEGILSSVQDTAVKASLHKNLGWAYFQQNLYEKAEEHLLKSLELDSKRALTYCLLAKVQENQGEKQSALESWDNCLKYESNDQQSKGLDQNLPELHIWKSEAHRALNDKSQSNLGG